MVVIEKKVIRVGESLVKWGSPLLLVTKLWGNRILGTEGTEGKLLEY